MKYYGRFEEFVPDHGYPSIRESFADGPYDGKVKILRYLRKSKYYAVSAGRYPVDAFTGEQLAIEPGIKTDGTYAWPAELEYYVDVYNLMLSDEFADYILSKPYQ